MKMERKELENLLVELLADGSGEQTQRTAALLGLYINRLSSDISEAVTPLTPVNAPFIVAILESYAEAIRKDFDCKDKLIQMIKAAQNGKITMVLPTEMTEREGDE